MDIHLEGEWTKPKLGSDFVLVDDVQEESRIIVFGTDADLSRLCESKTTSMDGTFNICPKNVYKLYVIHSRLTHGSVPELFCLLPDKKGSTYLRLMNLLKAKAIGMNLTFESKNVIMDFEIAVHNVVRDLMPSAHLKGCVFHFAKPCFRIFKDCASPRLQVQ